MIPYKVPSSWCHYNLLEVIQELAEAKGAVMSLSAMPRQKRWIAALQEMQLKLEIAGTSKIEGADFAGNELDLAMRETPEQLVTRSQRQAHSATQAYRWIATLPNDQPISAELICDIHRRIVQGADDDHCPPGKIREHDQNVTFGAPPHRGVEGGKECATVFALFAQGIKAEFRGHDPLIQALMAHYHFAAMHPFLDGNGRTARALEALMLNRAGLHETLFIAMSNYYYDEKKTYLSTLAEVRSKNCDMTSFIRFGLLGIALQTRRLADMLRESISKELYRSLLGELFGRLVSAKKRVIGKRQIAIAEYLLRHGKTELDTLIKAVEETYKPVTNPRKAIIRDLNQLLGLRAIRFLRDTAGTVFFEVRLDWPTLITESEFFEKIQTMSKAKATSFITAE